MIYKSFIAFLTHEKRYSAHTIRAYSTDFQQYASYLLETFEVEDVLVSTAVMVRSWMVSLMQAEVDPRSIRRKRSVLSTFFKFAIREGHLEKNPMDGVSTPKVQKKLPSYLRASELDRLEQALPEMTDYGTARDHAIIKMLFSTGMRRSELMQLTKSDVRLADRQIKVLGKRQKERLIPITSHLHETLTQYQSFREENESSEPWYFLTDHGNKLYPKYVYNLVKRYTSLVTSAEVRGPHTLRHTFATLMLDEGADINAIKELLGHADLNATQVYTHTSIEKLKKVYGQAHPRSRTHHLK